MNKTITGYKKNDRNFVLECNEKFDSILNSEVDKICVHGNVSVLGITGPSCSGKTTFAKKIIGYYSSKNIRVHTVSLDDFYRDMYSDKSAIDTKNVDFDSPDTMDMEEIEKFFHGLQKHGRAEKPVFDFLIGGRGKPESVEVKQGDIVIFEGIQLLYPEIYRLFKQMGGESIFISPESGISVGDRVFPAEQIRLYRRLVRDSNFRNSNFNITFDMWDGVRRNEELNIFPHIEECDIRIDTTQAYEINILKPYIEKYLGAVAKDNEYYEKAQSILSDFSDIQAIDASVLPENSIYKEFV